MIDPQILGALVVLVVLPLALGAIVGLAIVLAEWRRRATIAPRTFSSFGDFSRATNPLLESIAAYERSRRQGFDALAVARPPSGNVIPADVVERSLGLQGLTTPLTFERLGELIKRRREVDVEEPRLPLVHPYRIDLAQLAKPDREGDVFSPKAIEELATLLVPTTAPDPREIVEILAHSRDDFLSISGASLRPKTDPPAFGGLPIRFTPFCFPGSVYGRKRNGALVRIIAPAHLIPTDFPGPTSEA